MTFHLHIKGRVQGVGFRPHVYQHATAQNISGYVHNDADGVHVVFNHTSSKEANAFAEAIIQQAPCKAIIQQFCLHQIDEQHFQHFSICVQESNALPDLLIAPDFAFCPQCRKEFHDPDNRRYHYPFITCTLCGPRYSIIKRLPYERHLTTMQRFIQCPECQKEYTHVPDRRYFSQTNSCAVCGIQLSWQCKNYKEIITDPHQILSAVVAAFRQGKIVAVKGIGGFLLMCDAADAKAIQTLRRRKHRPKKPFAVLFPGIEMLQQYTYTNETAINALLGEASPIVVLPAAETCFQQLPMESIAPGLQSVGAMLPYAPILEWIVTAWKKPLIATSGNLSGSCIVFQSEQKEELFEFADCLLDHNREIVVPQDDSVIKVAEKSRQTLFIRRSRGFAPALILSHIKGNNTLFAAGALLKSAFAFQHYHQVYLSQFLGNMESYDTQQNYQHSVHHFLQLLQAQPQVVLADLHPDYPSTQLAVAYAAKWQAPIKKIQHHEAHFAAVLGEHDLFDSEEKILGVIWDGTGWGSDGNIWGGEFFVYEKGKMERVHYLEPFANIAGDKMAKEPRLAAFSIAGDIMEASMILTPKFSTQEWQYYQKVVQQRHLQNSSAGRYFDGIASLLNLIDSNTYEGEAALLLEQQAYHYLSKADFTITTHYYQDEITEPMIAMKPVIHRVIQDILLGKNKAAIAAAFHHTLVVIMQKVAHKLGIKKIAFSGGVFQNAVLIDLVYLKLEKDLNLYFHRQMPPNDECIAFGQIMHYQHVNA